MENMDNNLAIKMFGTSVSYLRKLLFRVLSVGPIPRHITFILDGNRRFAKKLNLGEGTGHKAGFQSLMAMLKYCNELGIKYVSIYAFSIDNFRRRPEEVKYVMDLMLEKIEGLLQEECLVNQYGIKVLFIGNLKLLNEPVRLAAEKAMKATANNSESFLIICVAYTSTNEIVHAAEVACQEKWDDIQELKGSRAEKEISEEKEEVNHIIKLTDIERHMSMAVAPDPDILIRSSGETRLSNFLLWQSSNCMLYSPQALWPEIGLRHLVWAVLNFQRVYPYLEKRKKQL